MQWVMDVALDHSIDDIMGMVECIMDFEFASTQTMR